MVTVRCKNCGEPREVTARQAGRAGLCRACLWPPKVGVTDMHRKYWLKHFSDNELAAMATELVGDFVRPAVFTAHRVALLGSADPPPS